MKKGEKLSAEWKFHEFSITQILREINISDSRSKKSAILTYLESPKAKNNQIIKIESP